MLKQKLGSALLGLVILGVGTIGVQAGWDGRYHGFERDWVYGRNSFLRDGYTWHYSGHCANLRGRAIATGRPKDWHHYRLCRTNARW